MAFDIYAAVTERIIAQLEAGTIPWQKPWIVSGTGSAAISYVTRRPYPRVLQGTHEVVVCHGY